MDDGNLEMSQMHVTELARYHSPDFYALELPFLFRDHDHASRVLEGKIGKSLLNDLTNNSPATGLAFTYSGGYRCIVSEEKITSLDDLAGLTYAVATNPISIDTVESIGAIPKVFHIRDFRIKANKVEGHETEVLETTIPRYLAYFAETKKKYLLNTKHSLFLTSIIIQNKFWQSLDADTQAKFNEACLYASRLERKWSVEDAENFANKLDHSNIGVEYSELSESEVEKFKQITLPLYDKYCDLFTPDLINGIIKS
jgi:TRAP-type C4-dicarboxylate transport system substrate-binding protein